MSALPSARPHQNQGQISSRLGAGNWTAVPNAYFDQLPRQLTYVEFVIVGVILRETIGAKGRPDRCQVTQQRLAKAANCTDAGVLKALQRLSSIGVLRINRIGRNNEYEPLIEEWHKPAQDRPPRKVKKVVEFPEPAKPGQVFVILPGSDKRIPLEEACKNASGCHLLFSREEKVKSENQVAENGELAERKPKLQLGNQTGQTEGEQTGPFVKSDLEDYLNRVIMPRLGTVAPAKVIDQAAAVLRGVPRGYFENRIMQRLGVVKAWGLVPELAQDAAQLHHRLKKISKSGAVSLEAYWHATAELRRMYTATDTSDEIRSEILAMWPELQQTAAAPVKKQSRLEQHFKGQA